MNTLRKYDILTGHNFQDEDMIKAIKDINLYDLMGVDHEVHVKRNAKFGFDLEVTNDEESSTYVEKEIHPYAIESLASFCRYFLHSYSNVLDKELV